MGYNLYIPIYLQDHLGLSPLQSGFIIFPLSVAWIILNFNLAKIENLCEKCCILDVYSATCCGIVYLFKFRFTIAHCDCGDFCWFKLWICLYKDSVIVQEETSPIYMKK